jgi:hypothetical protein
MNNRSKRFCYFALPVLLLAACVLQPSSASAQMTSVGIDCGQIQALQLLKQDNMGAGRALIECGIVQGGHPTTGKATSMPVPPNVRASNRACTSASSCTKSESTVWASTKNPKQIVANFNDSAGDGSDYSGTAYSADGGVTFKEIQPPPFRQDHGSNFGDPIVVFNSKLNKFFAGDIVSGCGGFGLGLWSSPNGKTWTVGSCPHNGNSDDRESMWVDNEPTSGTYGRMYISWNDFANNAALSVVYSDDGNTWTGPVILNNGNFIRDVQITGSPRGAARFEGKNSTVFVAGMDEGGGGLNTRQNLIYKSLDGGATWTTITMGPRFSAPGDGVCSSNSYFAEVNPIWRHMGWGQPAVGPKGVVHYVYAGHGTGNDTGDIFYTRSVNNGKTWSKAIKLNTDKDASFKTQWMPSLSVDDDGEVTASWYDRRAATSACTNTTDPGCKYERVGRQSKNNGVNFLAEITISSGVIPQPAQDDPFVQTCYAGDYDYSTALGGSAYVTWTDGRRAVGGINVQDVEFAKVPLP